MPKSRGTYRQIPRFPRRKWQRTGESALLDADQTPEQPLRPPVSREIVEYCKAHEVGIIAFPKYAESYEKHVKKASGNYSALHLSTRIREYLTYKAWQSGILVIDINAKGLHETCAVCGANIVSADKKTQECTCEAGHKTNRYLNIARNTAKRCLAQFQKKQKASETAG